MEYFAVFSLYETEKIWKATLRENMREWRELTQRRAMMKGNYCRTEEKISHKIVNRSEARQ